VYFWSFVLKFYQRDITDEFGIDSKTVVINLFRGSLQSVFAVSWARETAALRIRRAKRIAVGFRRLEREPGVVTSSGRPSV